MNTASNRKLVIMCSEPHAASEAELHGYAILLANYGGQVSPYGRNDSSATIESAVVEHLVGDIVVVGHTGCRAHAPGALSAVDSVRRQLQNLAVHPAVAGPLLRGELHLWGKVFDRETGTSQSVSLNAS